MLYAHKKFCVIAQYEKTYLNILEAFNSQNAINVLGKGIQCVVSDAVIYLQLTITLGSNLSI